MAIDADMPAERLAVQPPQARPMTTSKSERSRARSGRLERRVGRAGHLPALAPRMSAPHWHAITPAQRARDGTTPSTPSGCAPRAVRTTRLRTTPAQRALARRDQHDERSYTRPTRGTKTGLPTTLPSRPTGWHSAAASALGKAFKNPTISRAKRSAAMPGWATALIMELSVHRTERPHRAQPRMYR